MKKLIKAQNLVEKAEAALDAYQKNPDCEKTRKRAKNAKIKAEEYCDMHFTETHAIFEDLNQIHVQYHNVKDGLRHYSLSNP